MSTPGPACNPRLALILWEPLRPPYGLLLEEAALRECSGPTVLVWRHARSLIVGRRQEACEEVRCETASRLGVQVFRRSSGGGTVYHDPGNINFSLVCPETRLGVDTLYREGLGLLWGWLASLGVMPVEARNYNDTVYRGWKISGSSGYTSRRGSLFHATLLVSADTSMLRALLDPPVEEMVRRGVDPVKYRPRNLSSMHPHIDVWKAYSAVERFLRGKGVLVEHAIPARLYAVMLDGAVRVQFQSLKVGLPALQSKPE